MSRILKPACLYFQYWSFFDHQAYPWLFFKIQISRFRLWRSWFSSLVWSLEIHIFKKFLGSQLLTRYRDHCLWNLFLDKFSCLWNTGQSQLRNHAWIWRSFNIDISIIEMERSSKGPLNNLPDNNKAFQEIPRYKVN